MDPKLTLKTQEFTAFCRQLRATLGTQTSMQRVVDHEVGKVLEAALEKTERADAKKIRERVKNRSTFIIGGKRYALRNYKTGEPWRVPDSVWAEMRTMRDRSLARKLAAVGLSKKSWLVMAEKLGQTIKAPGYVKAARVSNAGFEGNARVERTKTGDRYGVRITNSMPILKYTPPGGMAAFFSALAGRINFFKMNVAKGVFNDAAATARKYKGVVVSQ